jgi:hypothetical protein
MFLEQESNKVPRQRSNIKAMNYDILDHIRDLLLNEQPWHIALSCRNR